MFIKPCEGRVSSGFGWRPHPINGKKDFHKGIDLAKAGIVPIKAAADGKVIRIGPLGTYGNIVIIRHSIDGKEFETNYAHLRDNSIKVKVGQTVKQGQQIALMGNTGGSTGQHLHFEIHVGRWATGQPNAVDPWPYISEPAVKPAVKPAAKPVVEESSKRTGIVTIKTEGLALRESPSLTGKLSRRMGKGESYKAYAKKGTWYNLGGGLWASEGAKGNHLAFEADKQSIEIVGVKQAAFIVATPSSNGNPVATIDLGKTIEINGSVPGWWEVKFNGRLGYVNEKFGRLI